MTERRGRMLTMTERLELAHRRLVRALDCGCEVGFYETFARRTLVIVDNPHDDCRERAHQADFVIEHMDSRRLPGGRFSVSGVHDPVPGARTPAWRAVARQREGGLPGFPGEAA